jgi:chemotaxis protein MotA
MSDTAQQADSTTSQPSLRIATASIQTDKTTIFGLIITFGLIATAILIGQSNANFINVPAILIVVLGTISVTAVAYSAEEIKGAAGVIRQSFIVRYVPPSVMARQLMDIAVLARKKGFLVLSQMEDELRKDPHLAEAVQIVTDGYGGDDVERILSQDIDSLSQRHRRAASILRRAADTAPAMGLIGTLIGLVQMLADLSNPDAIGPAMAVALLTTFYGAIMGTAVLAPMAAKLERNSNDEVLNRVLILTAMSSIARQENPRRLEMLLNSELPPDERIEYFD